MSDFEALVPIGAAYFPVPDPGPTRHYAFVLVPGFTLLAFSAAVEPLRIANQLSQRPLYRWQILSETGAPVLSSSGIPVGASGTLDNVGKDARLFVCAGNPAMAAAAPPVVVAVQRHHRFGGLVGGICTGAVALAKAGLVEGRRFTLHWENQPSFVETFPALNPTINRFEIDGRLMTCGGGAASTDMMLSIIAEDHGSDFAAMVSEMCLRTVMLGVEPEQRSSVAALMSSRNPVLVATITLMNRHIEDPLTMDSIAVATGYSRRQLERLFRDATGQAPAEFYRGLRLDRGRNLLSTTNMTLQEIATACGFESVSHFSRRFRERFGAAPSKLKQGSG
ncbi:GlxA family transcriptional regulator [Seohaeicola saemankumensis]|jgi:AraC family transcriptional regulator, carnitine catabolism transcriptional activator|uniref:GlxA family transcriptional regulator n=1 Tax=Seohaeicola TaxID=481178 RepID=UPI0007F32D69|nr:GlxA family transcriptional regulator [Paracoccaceae bacterium]OAN72455.1 transcriptional regulator [Rhodobacteraceae bacterium EhC02]